MLQNTLVGDFLAVANQFTFTEAFLQRSNSNMLKLAIR